MPADRGFIDQLQGYITGKFSAPPEGGIQDVSGIGRVLYGDKVLPTITPSTAAVITGNILSVAFGFLMIVFTIMVITAGAKWMGSQGDEEVLKKSRSQLIQASAGLLLAMLAFALSKLIVIYVFDKLGVQ